MDYDVYNRYTSEHVGVVGVEGDTVVIKQALIPNAWELDILPKQVDEYGWEGALAATRSLYVTPVSKADDEENLTEDELSEVEKAALDADLDLMDWGDISKPGDDGLELATGEISKSDEEQQIVYGWAYVVHDKDGNVVVDKSGEFVDDIREIEKAATKFMLTSRAGDTDHNMAKSTDIVESMVFTVEKTRAMGIPDGVVPTGWWIGAKCDDETWKAYKDGRFTSFSIHGSGVRKAV